MARPKGAKNKAKPAKAAKEKKPAKAAKAKPQAAAAAAEVGKAGQARKVITQNNLNVLMQTVAEIKGRADSQNGKLREAIAQAVQHQHLNKEVFALIRRLDKKEPEALLLFLEDFDDYLEKTGLHDRADSVGKLPLGTPTAADPKGGRGDDADDAGDGDDAQDAAGEDGPPTKIKPAEGVSRPAAAHTGEAPGGTVHMLPDRKAAGAAH